MSKIKKQPIYPDERINFMDMIIHHCIRFALLDYHLWTTTGLKVFVHVSKKIYETGKKVANEILLNALIWMK